MSKIEITTTQKVTIEYDLAAWGERLVAFIIDQAIIFFSFFMLMMGLEMASAGGWVILFMLLYVAGMVSIYILLRGFQSISVYTVAALVGFIVMIGFFMTFVEGAENTDILFYIFVLPVFLFYSLVLESMMDGQTIGKKAMGIKVVKVSGSEPTLSDYLIRWTFRPLDIWMSAGSVASLLIMTAPKSQRLGDILANTAVIRMQSRMNLRFEDIDRIKSIEDYEITYPGVRQFSEKDMLLVKSVITRYNRYPNEAHAKAVNEVLKIIMKKLQIVKRPKRPIKFLKTILNDYIVLTR